MRVTRSRQPTHQMRLRSRMATSPSNLGTSGLFGDPSLFTDTTYPRLRLSGVAATGATPPSKPPTPAFKDLLKERPDAILALAPLPPLFCRIPQGGTIHRISSEHYTFLFENNFWPITWLQCTTGACLDGNECHR